MKIKWGAIAGGIVGAAALLIGVPQFMRHNTGTKPADFPKVWERQRACAARVSGDSNVARAQLGTVVDGGVHVISADSLHRLLPNQSVLMLTRVYIDTTTHDTSVTIYGAPPIDDAALEHEYANAISWRFRRTMIGSDTGKFLTSQYYRTCVKYCPKCWAGAY